MTKQSIQQQPKGEGHLIANEELNENLILHLWRGVQEQVQRVIEFNKQQGIQNVDQFIGYNYDGIQLPMSVKQKIRWLGITKHKKSGAWITVDSLIASISNERLLEQKKYLELKYLQ